MPGELGRRHAPDTRDLNFLMRAMPTYPTRTTDRTYRYWGLREKDDQTGSTCVSNGEAHAVLAGPYQRRMSWLDAKAPAGYRSAQSGETGYRGWHYDRAQAIDEWSDTPPEGGTSVRAGFKVLVEDGLAASYWWAYDVEEVATTVLEHGPVVFGFNWYRGFMNDRWEYHDGGWWIGRNQSTWGSIEGGHAITATGVNVAEEKFRIFTWGHNDCWMTFATIDRLLNEDGEAGTYLEVAP